MPAGKPAGKKNNTLSGVSFAEFAPIGAKKVKSFLPVACTSAKILLGLPVCEQSECAQQAANSLQWKPSAAGSIG